VVFLRAEYSNRFPSLSIGLALRLRHSWPG
jgi:hypothetical protein